MTTSLDGLLHDIPELTREGMVRSLRQWANGNPPPYEAEAGICFNLKHFILDATGSMTFASRAYPIVSACARQWPKCATYEDGSRDVLFPVQMPMTHVTWDPASEEGKLRQELCDFVADKISECEERLP